MLSVLAIGVFGWTAGALVNYLAEVLPRYRRLVAPVCPQCGYPSAWQNYFLWPRRCSECFHSRGFWSFLVEGIFISATIWLWSNPPAPVGFWAGALLLTYFGVVVRVDIEHRLILHRVSLIGMLIGTGIGIWLHGPLRTVLGFVAGFGAMFILYLCGIFFMRLISRSRPGLEPDDALGFGDVMLSGVLGLMLGWPGIFIGLLLAVFLAGAASLFYLLAMITIRKYRSNLAIPYGPFLVLSAILMLFFRDNLITLIGR